MKFPAPNRGKGQGEVDLTERMATLKTREEMGQLIGGHVTTIKRELAALIAIVGAAAVVDLVGVLEYEIRKANDTGDDS